ncbi:MAG: SsrA-binding protein SmpB [Rickettsiales bacterium]
MSPRSQKAFSIQNKKARFNYFIEEEFEAGIVLTGTEVKSVRNGKVNIEESYAAEQGGEIWLINATIQEFEGGNRLNHEPRRHRKLLLKKKEINKLIGALRIKGKTLVPTALYINAKGLVKVKIGLGVGKKEYDKRQTIKERDWQRQKSAAMKKRPI